MDDIKLAMLGDKEAAKRLTDAGGAAGVSKVWWPWRNLQIPWRGLGAAVHGQVQEKRLFLDRKGLYNQKTGYT